MMLGPISERSIQPGLFTLYLADSSYNSIFNPISPPKVGRKQNEPNNINRRMQGKVHINKNKIQQRQSQQQKYERSFKLNKFLSSCIGAERRVKAIESLAEGCEKVTRFTQPKEIVVAETISRSHGNTRHEKELEVDYKKISQINLQPDRNSQLPKRSTVKKIKQEQVIKIKQQRPTEKQKQKASRQSFEKLNIGNYSEQKIKKMLSNALPKLSQLKAKQSRSQSESNYYTYNQKLMPDTNNNQNKPTKQQHNRTPEKYQPDIQYPKITKQDPNQLTSKQKTSTVASSQTTMKNIENNSKIHINKKESNHSNQNKNNKDDRAIKNNEGSDNRGYNGDCLNVGGNADANRKNKMILNLIYKNNKQNGHEKMENCGSIHNLNRRSYHENGSGSVKQRLFQNQHLSNIGQFYVRLNKNYSQPLVNEGAQNGISVRCMVPSRQTIAKQERKLILDKSQKGNHKIKTSPKSQLPLQNPSNLSNLEQLPPNSIPPLRMPTLHNPSSSLTELKSLPTQKPQLQNRNIYMTQVCTNMARDHNKRNNRLELLYRNKLQLAIPINYRQQLENCIELQSEEKKICEEYYEDHRQKKMLDICFAEVPNDRILKQYEERKKVFLQKISSSTDKSLEKIKKMKRRESKLTTKNKRQRLQLKQKKML